jgi:hypothetical protein
MELLQAADQMRATTLISALFDPAVFRIFLR